MEGDEKSENVSYTFYPFEIYIKKWKVMSKVKI